jgi:dienelactone hydrolase
MMLRLLAVTALLLAQDPPKPPPPTAPDKGVAAAPLALKLEHCKRIGAEGVTLSADYHALPYDDSERPLIVCFHMEGGSRGEFAKIAPRFGEFACSTFAVDLRTGKATDGVANETAASAAEVLKKTEFTNEEAFADVVEGLKWARELHPSGKLFALGSGTSAALVIAAAGRNPTIADALFLFSPGEDVPGWSIAMEAKKITVPTYVTCDGSPQEVAKARMIGNAIDKKLRQVVLPVGVQGAKRGAPVLFQEQVELRDRHWMTMTKLLLQLSPPLNAPSAPSGVGG